MSEDIRLATSGTGRTIQTRDVTRDIFSATIGSVCCCYVGQPFDTGQILSCWMFSVYFVIPLLLTLVLI
jgi:hypothetical protein